jgi:trimeric autotransporter adhesin
MRRAALMLAPAQVGSSSCFAMSWRVRRRPWWAAWLVVVVAVCVVALPTARVPAKGHRLSSRVGSSLPVAAWGPVSRALGRDDPPYRITRRGRVFVASDPGQLLREQFSSSSVSVGTGPVSLDVRVRGYGYGNALVMVPPRSPILSAGRIVYPTRQLITWYANGPLGLEQGFTLTEPPRGHLTGAFTVGLELSGSARASLSADGREVTFVRAGQELVYRGLVATDARGRLLHAWLTLRGRQLLIHVGVAGARYPLRIDPFFQQAKLTTSDGVANEFFGWSVAICGDTIVVGAPGATVNGNANQGAAYVFVKPRSGWADATQTAELTASDGAAGDQLGITSGLGNGGVAISGDTVVAGAPLATVDGNIEEGAVYVFVRPRTGWHDETQTAELLASDGAAGDQFGGTIAVSGNTVVAGAIFPDNLQGEAYLFTEPRNGWHNATETAKLIASDSADGDIFGSAAAISGGTIVISAVGDTVNGNSYQGAAYVFLEPRGGWRTENQVAKLTASDGQANDDLGVTVGISGRAIIAGAPAESGTHPGAVYVFTEPASGWRNETQTAKLTATDATADVAFGSWAAIDGDTIVAGAGFANQGSIYVFVEPRSGWTNETQTTELTASDGAPGDDLGFSVGISGDTIVGSAPFATVNGNASEGAVYVFGHDYR